MDLLDHPTPGARLAAVGELAALAAGANLARALAARLALTELVEDDSRRVSASAAEALRETAVRLPESSINLAAVRGGSTGVVAAIPVQGPPLALASSVATSGDGLRARLEAGALRITWSAQCERLDGSVTLSGPAGEACLRVTAGPGGNPPVADRAFAARRPGREALGRLRSRVPPVLRPRVRAAVLMLVAAPLIVFGVRAFVAPSGGGSRPALPAIPTALAVRPPDAPSASAAVPVVVATIRVGQEPGGVAVSADSRTVYVVNQKSGTLSMIDTSTRRKRAEVTLAHTPRFVALAPDGARVYVSTYEEDGAGSTLTAIDAVSGQVLGAVATGPKPFALAVAPDGLVWVPIHNASKVQIFDGRRLKAVATVVVPENPHAVVLSPDGRRAYTPDHESNLVSIVDTRTKRVVSDIAVGESPHSLAVAPDGRTVVVGDYGAAAVDIVDVATRRVTGHRRVGKFPQSTAVARDGRHAYTVNEGDDSLSTLTVPGGRVTATLKVGPSPRMITVAPDGRYAYVTNGGAGTLTVVKVGE